MRTPRLALLAAFALAAVPLAFGQHADAPAPPRPAYQLQFFLTTQPSGKPATVENYTMVVQAGSVGNSISTSVKKPMSDGGHGFAYMNVGVSLHCSLLPRTAPEGSLAVKVKLEIFGAESAPQAPAGQEWGPITSHMSAALQTVIPLGQKATISSFADATTHTHYQLAVLAQPADK